LKEQNLILTETFEGLFTINQVNENGTALIRCKIAKHDNSVNTKFLEIYFKPKKKKTKTREKLKRTRKGRKIKN
jgi:hypothetical protein